MYWTSANTVPAAVAGLYLLPDAALWSILIRRYSE